ncbi:MAG: polysaccharide ABC transporter ATP-binding protein, partial [Saprospiraceae bacterium]
METPILDIHQLSKQYTIGTTKERYLSIRDVIAGYWQRLMQQEKQRKIWALEDINLKVYPGETLGIIGRNGAGKSTFLKVISKITPPTKGRITARGRVASLLEVGTGFHPELTGRENIFLNGAILGLRRLEIKQKFDEIVDFSGVEQFIDTPLKHYSSGMQLRLAFAVAAHLEPEILLIDEVLAVGDAQFQKKCLGKMSEVSQSGRTILFVSHDMAAVLKLCQRSILLDRGKIIADGATEAIVQQYLQQRDENAQIDIVQRKDRKGKGELQFVNIALLNADEQAVENIFCGQTVTIALTLKNHQSTPIKN